MKKTALAILLAGAFCAHAQSVELQPSPGTLPAQPAVQLVTPAIAPAMPLTGDEVNPFNGKPLTAEEIQLELEASRLHTQLLEEKLKQVNLRAEMANIPLRKEVEAAQARTAAQKELNNQRDLELKLKAQLEAEKQKAEPKPEPKPVAEAPKPAPRKTATVRKPKQTEPARSEATSRPAIVARPTLNSIITVGERRSAVLEHNGATLIAADGERTPFGEVKVVDASSVTVGGMPLRVHSATLARFVTSDKAREPESVSAPTAAPMVGPNGPITSGASAPTQRVSLPPLPLPPGIQLQVDEEE